MSMERMMEIDYALRAALAAGDGETACAMVARQRATLAAMMEREPRDIKQWGSQVAALMDRNLELAREARETLRAEINTLDWRRKMVGDGGARHGQRMRRYFSA